MITTIDPSAHAKPRHSSTARYGRGANPASSHDRGLFMGELEMMFWEGLFANGRPEDEKELGAGIAEAQVLITVDVSAFAHSSSLVAGASLQSGPGRLQGTLQGSKPGNEISE